jgi:hypothetical protein
MEFRAIAPPQPYTVNSVCYDPPWGFGIKEAHITITYIPDNNGWKKDLACPHLGSKFGYKKCLFCSFAL